MNKDSKNESSLKQRQQEATRRAILEAAEAQLAERGLHGARMEDVAARAGVSVGTIYNHVGDRSALLSELLTARRTELIARIDQQLDASRSLGFEPQLAAFVRAVFDHFHSHLPLFRVVVQEEMQPDDAPKRSMLAALVERAAILIARGVAEGALPEHDTELYPMLLIGMMRGIFVHALRDDVELSGAAERVVSFFLAGARGS
jgi:AcrR family transcriptional regulator